MVIPTIAALVIRHFKKDTPEGRQEPKHAAVKFLMAAWNNGDFSEAGEQVAQECTIRMNGYTYDPETDVDGPAMARESIEYWRAIFPNIKMELIQEIEENDRIAVEWFLTGTHTGDRVDLPASGKALELRGSAFLTLEKDKVVEVSTAFDALALAVQTGSLEPPEWWPGRQSP